MKKLTHSEFCQRVIEWQGEGKYTLLSEYEGSKVPMLIRHNFCGEQWEVKPYNIKKLKGCVRCKRASISNSRKKSPLAFENEVNSLGEYELIGEYLDSRSKVSIKHKSCGNIFLMSPAKFSYGQRCPKCSRPNYARTNEHFLAQMTELVGDEYTPLEKFKGVEEKILVIHNTCGYNYLVSPHKFINGGRRCPNCAKNILKDTETFSKEVDDITGGEYSLISEYVSSKEHVKLRHELCGHEWLAMPHNFSSGKRCPKCNQSRGEHQVENYLKSIHANFETQYRIEECKIKLPLPFDFAILRDSEPCVLIEYQGEQHYKEMTFFGGIKGFEYQKKRDSVKREYCKKNKIPLIEVPYTVVDINKYLDEKISAYL